jgi:dTDP-4-dehydrorhamnose 3,5-epimerase
MHFTETVLPGAFILDPERVEDERGYFARVWCREELAARGLDARVSQSSISYNRVKGTVRGLHYQIAPHEEAKVVACIRGAIQDVIVDLRPDSPSYLHHFWVRLDALGYRMLYVPPGIAHGFQTLEDDTVVLYQISEPYRPEAGRGVRWDDPVLGLAWPLPVAAISDRDRSYPDIEVAP